MDTFHLLMGGFATVLQPANLLFALLGCVLGTMVGVLPGVGPSAATAILIPVTMAMNPTAAIIMLAAIYYGAMYGGTITSVLLNVPGEAASVVTCLDGYEMAKRGRAGPALAIAAIGSFIGGSVATIGLVLVAMPLTRFALSFGPARVLRPDGDGLVDGDRTRPADRCRGRSPSAILGLLLAQIGIDLVTGAPRFTFGRMELLDGFGIVPVVMGLFGIGEILLNAEAKATQIFDRKDEITHPFRKGYQRTRHGRSRVARSLDSLLVSSRAWGAIVPTYLSYAIEKRMSKTPERFGTGSGSSGGSRAGDDEKRVCHCGAHSAIYLGHPRQCHHRHLDGRSHEERAHPWGHAFHGASPIHLGRDRELLHR